MGESRLLLLLLMFSLYLVAKTQSVVTGQPPITLEWKDTWYWAYRAANQTDVRRDSKSEKTLTA